MKNFLFIIALTGLTLLQSCGVADDRESQVHDYLQQRITDESSNAFKLEKFTKTNGLEQEMAGMKVYVLEWEATISTQKDVWKDGVGMLGYFSDFKVLEKNRDDITGNRPYFKMGANISLKGNCKLEKTEKGWRVKSYHTGAWKNLSSDAASPAK